MWRRLERRGRGRNPPTSADGSHSNDWMSARSTSCVPPVPPRPSVHSTGRRDPDDCIFRRFSCNGNGVAIVDVCLVGRHSQHVDACSCTCKCTRVESACTRLTSGRGLCYTTIHEKPLYAPQSTQKTQRPTTVPRKANVLGTPSANANTPLMCVDACVHACVNEEPCTAGGAVLNSIA